MVNFSISDSDGPVLPPLPDEAYEFNRNDLPCLEDPRPIHPQPWCGQHLANGDAMSKNFYNYTNQEEKEKTPMCRIAELARYHKLKYKYRLMDESGPAHKKLFTVQLVLCPDQVYEGSGASIKKAQQAAASEALKNTRLTKPPEKLIKKKKDVPSAVLVLSQIAHRMNLREPVYRTHTKRFPPPPQRVAFPPSPVPLMFQNIPPPPSAPGVVPFLSPTPSLRGPSGAPPMLMNLSEFSVCVSVGIYPGKMFTGMGPNYNYAKEDAAAQAARFLAPMLQQMESSADVSLQKIEVCPPLPSTEPPSIPLNSSETGDSSQNDGDVPKHRQKSVISHVHECALQMKLNVEFEVLLEDGPPHERTYIVKCALLNANNEVVVEDTGDGRKKKEATQAACCNVLNRLRSFESPPLILASNLLKSQSRKGPPREPKKKTIVKDMKMDPSYGHQINPVSRLIQVAQARGEVEPTFALVGEHGQSRYKEFVMEVMCGDRFCTGTGPNKRLAKRAAAEAMLAEIGYVKPLPPPGKSLLKKRNDPMLNIGVFDMNEMKLELSNSEEKSKSSLDSSKTASWELSVDATPPSDSTSSSEHVSPNDEPPAPLSPGSKRRVTFNTQVEACPPPEDANYPQPEVAPLKADVMVEGRLKRMRKAKEGKRKLTEQQQNEIVDHSLQFIATVAGISTFDGADSLSRLRLEEFSEKYKFSVQFTNFPKSPDGNDQTYFALVSLGLERPLVCHGSGQTVDAAADNAAYNAICCLAKLNDPQASPVPQ